MCPNSAQLGLASYLGLIGAGKFQLELISTMETGNRVGSSSISILRDRLEGWVDGVQKGADMEKEIVDAKLSKQAYSNLEDTNVLKPVEDIRKGV